MPEEPENQEPKGKPVATYRAGAMSASVWSNNATDSHGQPVERLSVTVQKRIKDPETEEYRTVKSLFDRDIPRLQMVAQKAFEFMMLRSDEPDQGPPA